MCIRGTCPTCHKASWWGCSKHVPDVMDSVPTEERYVNHLEDAIRHNELSNPVEPRPPKSNLCAFKTSLGPFLSNHLVFIAWPISFVRCPTKQSQIWRLLFGSMTLTLIPRSVQVYVRTHNTARWQELPTNGSEGRLPAGLGNWNSEALGNATHRTATSVG